uniref:Uncharacterized protein n=1 Tax=Gadus morhua TaxID=8049 RepID=A0A8C5FLM3_GADMO
MVRRDFVSKVKFYSHLIEATATDRVVVRVDHLVSPDLTTQRLISPFVCCFTDKRIWAEIRTKPVSAYLAQTTRIQIGNIPHIIKRILCHLESLPQPTFILAFPCANSLNGASSYNFDIAKKSDLTRLYNSKVYKAERMRRPFGILGTTIGPISHTGFVVTLEDGSRGLIHKGNGFGNSSQTVVVDVKHMSSDWKNNFKGKKTVADFVADGGSKYCLLFNNCRDATTRMMTPFRE